MDQAPLHPAGFITSSTFITSASALELYDRFYAKDISPLRFLVILDLDPTSKYDNDTVNAKLSAYDRAREILTTAVFGKYTKALLSWLLPESKYLSLRKERLQFQSGISFNAVSAWITVGEYGEDGGPSAVSYTEALRSLLQVYDEGLKYLPQEWKSITKFRTADDFIMFMRNVFPGFIRTAVKREVEKSIRMLGEDDTWLVVAPLTHKASQYYASDSKWCTASSSYDSNYFNQYTRNGVLIMFMNKNDRPKSFQVFLPYEDHEAGFTFDIKDFYDQPYQTIDQRNLYPLISKFTDPYPDLKALATDSRVGLAGITKVSVSFHPNLVDGVVHYYSMEFTTDGNSQAFFIAARVGNNRIFGVAGSQVVADSYDPRWSVTEFLNKKEMVEEKRGLAIILERGLVNPFEELWDAMNCCSENGIRFAIGDGAVELNAVVSKMFSPDSPGLPKVVMLLADDQPPEINREVLLGLQTVFGPRFLPSASGRVESIEGVTGGPWYTSMVFATERSYR